MAKFVTDVSDPNLQGITTSFTPPVDNTAASLLKLVGETAQGVQRAGLKKNLQQELAPLEDQLFEQEGISSAINVLDEHITGLDAESTGKRVTEVQTSARKELESARNALRERAISPRFFRATASQIVKRYINDNPGLSQELRKIGADVIGTDPVTFEVTDRIKRLESEAAQVDAAQDKLNTQINSFLFKNNVIPTSNPTYNHQFAQTVADVNRANTVLEQQVKTKELKAQQAFPQQVANDSVMHFNAIAEVLKTQTGADAVTSLDALKEKISLQYRSNSIYATIVGTKQFESSLKPVMDAIDRSKTIASLELENELKQNYIKNIESTNTLEFNAQTNGAYLKHTAFFNNLPEATAASIAASMDSVNNIVQIVFPPQGAKEGGASISNTGSTAFSKLLNNLKTTTTKERFDEYQGILQKDLPNLVGRWQLAMQGDDQVEKDSLTYLVLDAYGSMDNLDGVSIPTIQQLNSAISDAYSSALREMKRVGGELQSTKKGVVINYNTLDATPEQSQSIRLATKALNNAIQINSMATGVDKDSILEDIKQRDFLQQPAMEFAQTDRERKIVRQLQAMEEPDSVIKRTLLDMRDQHEASTEISEKGRPLTPEESVDNFEEVTDTEKEPTAAVDPLVSLKEQLAEAKIPQTEWAEFIADRLAKV